MTTFCRDSKVEDFSDFNDQLLRLINESGLKNWCCDMIMVMEDIVVSKRTVQTNSGKMCDNTRMYGTPTKELKGAFIGQVKQNAT